MTTELDIIAQKNFARNEGHAEGLEIGLAEGRAKGLKEGLKEGRAEGREEGREKPFREMQEGFFTFALIIKHLSPRV